MHEKETKYTSIEWRNGQPYSTVYEDVYFSTDASNPNQGLEETEYVFLNHNHLAERWQTLSSPTFLIAETGFGTGLNFLSAIRLWLDTAPQNTSLHFISVEKHPLSPDQLQQVYALWPQFKDISDALLEQYSTLTDGFHRFNLLGNRVVLTLLIGEATNMFSQLYASVDAWFLDGFSPAKNPDMWQPALYQQMARLSHGKTTFATFTSAGMVRRGLEAVGFNVEKATGYGRKREMCHGQFNNPDSEPIKNLENDNQEKSVIIIGAGIAGCATAYALANRGWQVTMIERHDSIAQEASGNPRGVIYPRLASHSTPQDQLALNAFLYTLRLLTQLPLSDLDFGACGLLQLGFNQREATRLMEISKRGLGDDFVRYLDSDEASEVAGIRLGHHALYFPQAGWLNPQACCAALIKHPNIKLLLNTSALRLNKLNAGWQVQSSLGESLFSHAVVISNANDALSFEQSSHLSLTAVRGQMSTVCANTYSKKLKTVVCTDGYLTPASADSHCLGATFASNEMSMEIREADNLSNLKMIQKMSVDLKTLKASNMQGRAALRCSTPDYLPMVGELLDAAHLKDAPPKHMSPPPTLARHQNLYMNVGHGSKGLTAAPYCAEILAAMMSHEPLPAPIPFIQLLNPNRFLLKSLGLKRLIHSVTLR